jgi:alginate O-acetyltransferase complex protein AlgI
MESKAPLSRGARLACVLVALCAPLFIVKYSHFLAEDVFKPIPGLGAVLGDTSFLKFGLPLGISFVTFTLIAYVVDVYRGRYPIERRLPRMLGYVLFFPHLIAGPILRPNELLPQLQQKRRAIDARITLGLAIFSLGLVKKLVFADTIAGFVDGVYKSGAAASGWDYLLAMYGFSMQIYCDFSGYTDMAIGIAYIICVRLPTNFLRPYGARSIVDFWRRWHITLSHWLRDYLYIPLGGGRSGQARQLINLMVTMVLGGLWHGAAWTFVVWGTLHGMALSANHLFSRRLGLRLPGWVALLLTFHFVTITWVFFRAPNLAVAGSVLAGPFTASWAGVGDFLAGHLFELLLLAVFLALHRFDRHARIRWAVKNWDRGIIWPIILLSWIVAITVSQGSSAKFIYFDF